MASQLASAETKRPPGLRQGIEAVARQSFSTGKGMLGKGILDDFIPLPSESLGLSLADIRQRTGIEKGNLSRLENAMNPNPTIDTLSRYADAVGKEIVIALVDKAEPSHRTSAHERQAGLR
jgi:hypothetical protein